MALPVGDPALGSHLVTASGKQLGDGYFLTYDLSSLVYPVFTCQRSSTQHDSHAFSAAEVKIGPINRARAKPVMLLISL